MYHAVASNELFQIARRRLESTWQAQSSLSHRYDYNDGLSRASVYDTKNYFFAERVLDRMILYTWYFAY